MDDRITLSQLADQTEALAQVMETWLEDLKNNTPKPADLAKNFFYVKEEYDRMEKARKRIYAVKDTLDKFLLPNVLEANGTDMIRVPEIARSFSIRMMSSASMLDKERGFEWLREQGHGDLIQETVNAGTLSSFFRNLLLEEGIEPPDDIFKVSTYKSMSVNKYTPK